MLVKQEQLNPCEVELEVEVDSARVSSAIDETYSEIAKTTTVPGFRKGKAPRPVLKNYLDAEKVKDSAARSVMRDAYSAALEESKLKPYAPADVEVVRFEEGQSMLFKAKVPLPPQVELGEYVGLEVERQLRPVTEEDVDQQIEAIRDRHAEPRPVTDRPVQTGDLVTARVSEREDDCDSRPLRIVAGDNLPDFDNGLIGMAVGECKTLQVSYPEDYASEELRGQTRSVTVGVVEIEEKQLPELNDEWVRSVYASDEPEETPESERVDSVEKLRARIRSLMEKSAVDEADQAVEEKLIEQVVKNSSICFPDVMVEELVDERLVSLSESLGSRKVTLEDYLKYTKQTIEDLRKSYDEDARRQLELLLVFREIVDKEKLEVTDEDFDAEIRRIAQQRNTTPEAVRAYVDSSETQDTIRNRVLRKKVVDFVVNASNIKNVGR